jgi:hypothetical protein
MAVCSTPEKSSSWGCLVQVSSGRASSFLFDAAVLLTTGALTSLLIGLFLTRKLRVRKRRQTYHAILIWIIALDLLICSYYTYLLLDLRHPSFVYRDLFS